MIFNHMNLFFFKMERDHDLKCDLNSYKPFTDQLKSHYSVTIPVPMRTLETLQKFYLKNLIIISIKKLIVMYYNFQRSPNSSPFLELRVPIKNICSDKSIAIITRAN